MDLENVWKLTFKPAKKTALFVNKQTEYNQNMLEKLVSNFRSSDLDAEH